MAQTAVGRFNPARWMADRHRMTRRVTLDRRRVYILPTRAGLGFAVVLLVMLVGAINYANSLAFMLTFLVTGVGVISILHTYRNLHGLTFTVGQARGVHAGDRARFALAVTVPEGPERLAIEVQPEGGEQVVADLAGGSEHWLAMVVPAPRRGRLPMPLVTVATRFPLGLFRAWSYLRLDQSCVVYPRPEAEVRLPLPNGGGAGAGAGHGEGADDFSGMRGYQPGDSPRRIDWKVFARGQGLVTKQFAGERSPELWLNWDTTAPLPTEQRLSRLCGWVLEADRLGLRYGLELPDRRLEPNTGAGHRVASLEALALYGVGNRGA